MLRLNFSWKDTPTSRIVYVVQVLLQFLAAVVVLGINASIAAGDSVGISIATTAIAAATLSIITTIFFVVDIFYPFPSRLWLLWILFWQWVLTLFWLGVVVVFARQYFSQYDTQVNIAGGFIIANMLLWLMGSVFGTGLMCFRRRLARKQHSDSHEMT